MGSTDGGGSATNSAATESASSAATESGANSATNSAAVSTGGLTTAGDLDSERMSGANIDHKHEEFYHRMQFQHLLWRAIHNLRERMTCSLVCTETLSNKMKKFHDHNLLLNNQLKRAMSRNMLTMSNQINEIVTILDTFGIRPIYYQYFSKNVLTTEVRTHQNILDNHEIADGAIDLCSILYLRVNTQVAEVKPTLLHLVLNPEYTRFSRYVKQADGGEVLRSRSRRIHYIDGVLVIHVDRITSIDRSLEMRLRKNQMRDFRRNPFHDENSVRIHPVKIPFTTMCANGDPRYIEAGMCFSDDNLAIIQYRSNYRNHSSTKKLEESRVSINGVFQFQSNERLKRKPPVAYSDNTYLMLRSCVAHDMLSENASQYFISTKPGTTGAPGAPVLGFNQVTLQEPDWNNIHRELTRGRSITTTGPLIMKRPHTTGSSKKGAKTLSHTPFEINSERMFYGSFSFCTKYEKAIKDIDGDMTVLKPQMIQRCLKTPGILMDLEKYCEHTVCYFPHEGAIDIDDGKTLGNRWSVIESKTTGTSKNDVSSPFGIAATTSNKFAGVTEYLSRYGMCFIYSVVPDDLE